MAEGKDSALKDLEQEITCGICHQHYQEPKVLSCCHYYCKECVLNLARKAGLDKPFSCPECRKDTTLPQGSLDKLQGAFFINRLKYIHSKFEWATGKVEANCEMCCEDKATAFCRQCSKFLCVECVKSHQRMKMAFPNHKIATLEELKQGGADAMVIPEPIFQSCKIHDKKLKMFCTDCGCLICRDCTMKDHHGHNYEFVKKAAPEVKERLGRQLKPLEKTKGGLMDALQEVQATRSELEAEGHAVVQCIEKWCNELCQIIQDHKKQLVEEVKGKIAEKSKHLSDQEKGLARLCARADTVIKYAQCCMEHSTDDEIMCMNSDLQH